LLHENSLTFALLSALLHGNSLTFSPFCIVAW
jgi:hypothetical protein